MVIGVAVAERSGLVGGALRGVLSIAPPRLLTPLVDRVVEPPGQARCTWYGHVFAFTEDGHVVADLRDPSGRHPETTGATETSDRLYVQNLHLHSIGWLAR